MNCELKYIESNLRYFTCIKFEWVCSLWYQIWTKTCELKFVDISEYI